jgi:hypothetical protein
MSERMRTRTSVGPPMLSGERSMKSGYEKYEYHHEGATPAENKEMEQKIRQIRGRLEVEVSKAKRAIEEARGELTLVADPSVFTASENLFQFLLDAEEDPVVRELRYWTSKVEELDGVETMTSGKGQQASGVLPTIEEYRLLMTAYASAVQKDLGLSPAPS